MLGDNACHFIRIWRQIPRAALVCAAENDAVASREHVEFGRECRVCDFFFRLQNRELAFDWRQHFIAEQFLCA